MAILWLHDHWSMLLLTCWCALGHYHVGTPTLPLLFSNFITAIVRPNPPPLSVLVRVMVLRITCSVCSVKIISSHPKAFMSFWITLFIRSSLLARGRVGLFKGPTGSLGNTSPQGYSPLAFDYPFLHLAIARVFHFFHDIMHLSFFKPKVASVEKHFSQWVITCDKSTQHTSYTNNFN